MDETTVLFRPVGQKEFDLIRESDFTAFPPRLPQQPIFYPVLNEHYATQIAPEWNANSQDENRFIIIGLSYQLRHLVVVHSDRGDRIRIISARVATPSERKEYESGTD